MATRTPAVGTQTDADFLTDAEYNDAPGGWVAWVQKTSDQGSITSPTAVTGLTVTFTPTADRMYLVMLSCRATNGTASKGSDCVIRQAGTQIKRGVSYSGTADRATQLSTWVIVDGPAASSTTWDVYADVIDGGTVTVRAATDDPAELLIVDIGPAAP